MKGKLLIISGLSAAGKGTIAKAITDQFENYVLSISATTRDMRKGEVDGKSYFFLSKNEFEEMIKKDELLEYASYVGNFYGTPKKYVIDRLNEGKNVILEIEMQGALKVKKIFDEAILIFFLPKDAKTQYQRLIYRGRENKEQIEKRLTQAVLDASYAKQYDFILVNYNLEGSIDDIKNIVNGTYDKSNREKNMLILEQLVKDIKEEKYV